MYASVYFKPGEMTVQEVPDPKISPKEVLLRVRACGVCGFDVRVYRDGSPKVKPPVILGHEISGEIARVGSSLSDFHEGMRIAIYPIMPCGKCKQCLSGQYNLCDDRQEIGSTYNGGFAEYIRVPFSVIQVGGLVEIPNYLSYDEAALSEPLACCINGINKMNVSDADNVAIIGDGTIGLLHLQLARSLGANTIVIGRINERLQVAKVLGANLTVNSLSHDPIREVLEFTQGKGADAIIVAVGDVNAIQQALKMITKNGKINIFAGTANNATLCLDPNILHYSEITLTGSCSSTPILLSKALSMISSDKVRVKPLITHRFKLSKIMQGFRVAENYLGLRAVINP